LLAALVFLLPFTAGYASMTLPSTRTIISEMDKAFSRVSDYRADFEVREYDENGSLEIKEFAYTFKKPNRIRIDLTQPRRAVLIYPDKNGKVAVRPAGWLGFVELHLSPHNRMVAEDNGQRIDQTDLGHLIRNIAGSLGPEQHGPVDIKQENGLLEIQVLAQDHFAPGKLTDYTFGIDKNLWLPVYVEESSETGRLQRTVHIRNLETNTGVPDSHFQFQ
jgi:outer membrane lipoprotein-sorting protein